MQADASLTVLYRPAAHASQAVGPPGPADPENLPGAHDAQTLRPTEALKRPLEHGEHSLARE